MDDPTCRRCGHPVVAHEHYRPGRECALCYCPRCIDRLTPTGAAWGAWFAVRALVADMRRR